MLIRFKTLAAAENDGTTSQELGNSLALAAKESVLPDPFSNGPEWVLSYHCVHGKNRPLLVIEDKRNIVLFAEERLEDDTIILVPLESSWLYDRPFLGPDPIPLFFYATECIEEHYGREHFPLLLLGGMWPGHPECTALLLHLGHMFSFFRHTKGMQGAASLEGGLDGFLSRRSANFRSKLKKAVRKAREEDITYTRIVPKTECEAKETFARMLEVEKRSWKGLADNGIVSPLARDFYAELLSRLAREGRARVILAEQEGQDIGFIFGGIRDSIYRGEQFSYDQSWAHISLGNTLQYEQIRWLCEESIHRYDMGPITGPRMDYKRHWTELTFPLESWIARRN